MDLISKGLGPNFKKEFEQKSEKESGLGNTDKVNINSGSISNDSSELEENLPKSKSSKRNIVVTICIASIIIIASLIYYFVKLSNMPVNQNNYPVLDTISSNSKTKTIQSSGVEDFDIFYKKFLADSLFQKSRTKFPMEGGLYEPDGETKWTASNLGLMLGSIYEIDPKEYRTSVSKTNNSCIMKVWIEGAGYSREDRFKLIDGKWYRAFCIISNF